MNVLDLTQQTGDLQLRQGERIAEGLAWWGIVTAIIAAAVGGVSGASWVIYLLAIIAAATTTVWFHVIPKPFENRRATIVALAILISTISAFNYYTGGVHSPLFVLYYVPLLAAFFLFRPKLQLILGAAEHACFIAQFSVPVLLEGASPDWTTFAFRSLQLAALGFAAYYAARSARGRISVFQEETQAIAAREERLLFVAQVSQELGAADDHDEVIVQTLKTASSIFDAKVTFLTRVADGRLEDLSPLCLRESDGSTTEISDQVGEKLSFLGRVLEDRAILQLSEWSDTDSAGFAGKYGIASMLLVPVERRGELLGVLGVATAEVKTFAEEEIRLVKLFAGEVAVHLDRSLKIEAAKALLAIQTSAEVQIPTGQSASEQIGLLVNDMASAKTLAEATKSIPSVMAALTEASDSAVYVLHESGARIEKLFTLNGGCRFPSNVRECPVIHDKTPIGDLVGTEVCRFMPMMRRHCICEPLVQGEHLIGVLQVQGASTKGVPGTPDILALASRSLCSSIAGIRSLEHRESSGFFDKLTQAYSRPFIELQINYYHRLTRKAGRQYSVIMFGIDGLRKVNQTFGMMMGDRTVQCFVETAKAELSGDEIFGRWQGDLFIVCIPESKKNEVFELAERVRASAQEAFARPELGHRGTVSAAIFTSFGGGPLSEVIEGALQRLERAKAFGGNRVESG